VSFILERFLLEIDISKKPALKFYPEFSLPSHETTKHKAECGMRKRKDRI
jgi:hypothetical protein